MNQVNQYAISQALGSKMHPVRKSGFGGFALLQSTAEIVRLQHSSSDDEKSHQFTYAHDRVVARAFEEVRDGASTDSILWNRLLQQQFTQRCRELGLDAPDALLNRRLLNIRKNQKRYEKHGIKLTPTTKKDPHPGIVSKYAHIIEFALVRLRYRYGVSIDDVLLDPSLSDQFERLALDSTPQLSPQDLRLGALNIRKSRFLAKKDKQTLDHLDLTKIDRTYTQPQHLSEVDVSEIPDTTGLIELMEGDKYLYIARNDQLRTSVEQFLIGNAFEIVKTGFWAPNPDLITIQYAVGKSFEEIGIGKWEKRLIHDRDPIFNWPIHKTAV